MTLVLIGVNSAVGEGVLMKRWVLFVVDGDDTTCCVRSESPPAWWWSDASSVLRPHLPAKPSYVCWLPKFSISNLVMTSDTFCTRTVRNMKYSNRLSFGIRLLIYFYLNSMVVSIPKILLGSQSDARAVVMHQQGSNPLLSLFCIRGFGCVVLSIIPYGDWVKTRGVHNTLVYLNSCQSVTFDCLVL
jgi:hypothetical protein